jgi:NAD(P)-dependent dehydrogenase (short-subunit alcohol dehydrogenase family)
MEALAIVLAQELAAEAVVRVNTLVPGPVDSPLRKKAYPAEDKRQVPTMAQLAPAYVYCFSDASIGVTGQVLDARQWIN